VVSISRFWGVTRTGRWRGIERGVARRVWTRVAEKKEDLGAEVRITGASKGDRLRGSGTDTLLHRRDHGYPLFFSHYI